MNMLYKSPFIRWVLVTSGFVAGYLLVFGSSGVWRSTPSLRWIDHNISLKICGVALMVYAVLLIFDRTRPAGFAFGVVLFSLFTWSLLLTAHITTRDPKNAVVLAMAVDTVAFHIFAVRTAFDLRASRELS